MDADVEWNFADLKRKIYELEQVFTDGEDDLRRRRDLRRQMRHMRQFVWIITTAFGLFATGLAIVAALVHTSDIDQLEKFKSDLKADLLGQSEGGNLLLYGINNQPLDGQTILVSPNEYVRADKYKFSPTWGFEFFYVAKNDSDYPSGTTHAKVFYTDPIKGQIPSSNFQDQFKYEINITPSNPDSLPGRFTTTYVVQIVTAVDKPLKLIKSPALIEEFYGKGKSVKASIYLRTP
ncbi:MAG: hypothetical protein JOZ11_12270 [Alphaproteobacteria bacterium]|nr:hypothetical protein [Alphaproteobacteria bacterium]